MVGLTGLGQPLFHLGLVRKDGHLHLVHDGPKVGMEARIKDLAKVLQLEAFLGRRLADPDPGDVALADVLDA